MGEIYTRRLDDSTGMGRVAGRSVMLTSWLGSVEIRVGRPPGGPGEEPDVVVSARDLVRFVRGAGLLAGLLGESAIERAAHVYDAEAMDGKKGPMAKDDARWHAKFMLEAALGADDELLGSLADLSGEAEAAVPHSLIDSPHLRAQKERTMTDIESDIEQTTYWSTCEHCLTQIIVSPHPDREDDLPEEEEWKGRWPDCPICGSEPTSYEDADPGEVGLR